MVSLGSVAVKALEVVGLTVVFNAFCNDVKIEGMAKRDHVLDNRAVGRVFVDSLDE